jgi:hypothetical protein
MASEFGRPWETYLHIPVTDTKGIPHRVYVRDTVPWENDRGLLEAIYDGSL